LTSTHEIVSTLLIGKELNERMESKLAPGKVFSSSSETSTKHCSSIVSTDEIKKSQGNRSSYIIGIISLNFTFMAIEGSAIMRLLVQILTRASCPPVRATTASEAQITKEQKSIVAMAGKKLILK
jgi:hypothetical protein